MKKKPLYQIKFRYKNKFTRGNWSEQTCIMPSVKECIEWYGLGVDCEYEILSVEEIAED